jgi:MFS family permease
MSKETATLSKPLLGYLIITAIVSGALVMVVEVMGSRVIGPFFGSSLFIWTSLITVTLLALAAGYAVGGAAADRWPAPGALFAIIATAGVLVFLVPELKAPVIKMSQPFGLRAGAFTATLLLFGPALFCMGCVSPYVIRIAATQMRALGRTVGGFYALSTFGSVVGTVLSGFFLIEYLGVNGLFYLTGALLILLAAGYFLAFRRKLLALVPLLVLVAPQFSEPINSKPLSNGTLMTLLESKDTFYGNLKVVEYSFGPRRIREMLIDGLIQGGIDPNNGLSIYGYAYAHQHLPPLLNPGTTTALVIGLGAGLVPASFEKRGIKTDVVDINPGIEPLARRYFNYAPANPTIIADGRQFITNSDKRYDIILLDAFNGDGTPGYLLSREFMDMIREHLNPGGLLAINLIADFKPGTIGTSYIDTTLNAVFDNVDFYPLFDVGKRPFGNIAIMAYDGPPRRVKPSAIEGIEMHRMAKEIRKQLLEPIPFKAAPDTQPLTDDFNPLDIHETEIREAVRRDILTGADWDLLMR